MNNRKRNRAISGQLRSISDLSSRGVINRDQKGQLKEWVIQGDRRAMEFLNLHEDDNLASQMGSQLNFPGQGGGTNSEAQWSSAQRLRIDQDFDQAMGLLNPVHQQPLLPRSPGSTLQVVQEDEDFSDLLESMNDFLPTNSTNSTNSTTNMNTNNGVQPRSILEWSDCLNSYTEYGMGSEFDPTRNLSMGSSGLGTRVSQLSALSIGSNNSSMLSSSPFSSSFFVQPLPTAPQQTQPLYIDATAATAVSASAAAAATSGKSKTLVNKKSKRKYVKRNPAKNTKESAMTLNISRALSGDRSSSNSSNDIRSAAPSSPQRMASRGSSTSSRQQSNDSSHSTSSVDENPTERKMTIYNNIINAMRHPEYGLEVRDRRYRFVKYKDCFIGSQAVEWLCNGVPDLKRDRKHALKLARSLLREGFFHHVLKAHDFKDKFLFYKFNEDIKQWWTIDLEVVVTKMTCDNFLIRNGAEVTGKELVDWCLRNISEQVGTTRTGSVDQSSTSNDDGNGTSNKKEKWKNANPPVMNLMQRLLRARYLQSLDVGSKGDDPRVRFRDNSSSRYAFTLLAQQVRDAHLAASGVAQSQPMLMEGQVPGGTVGSSNSNQQHPSAGGTYNPDALNQVSQQIQQMKQMEQRLKLQILMMQQQQQQKT